MAGFSVSFSLTVGRWREKKFPISKEVKRMSATTLKRVRKELRGEPTWEVALLYPPQGTWSEEEYLELDTNRLVEFTAGRLEFLPMPTKSHQKIVLYLVNILSAFIEPRKLGQSIMAGFPVRISAEKYREPDIVFLSLE